MESKSRTARVHSSPVFGLRHPDGETQRIADGGQGFNPSLLDLDVNVHDGRPTTPVFDFHTPHQSPFTSTVALARQQRARNNPPWNSFALKETPAMRPSEPRLTSISRGPEKAAAEYLHVPQLPRQQPAHQRDILPSTKVVVAREELSNREMLDPPSRRRKVAAVKIVAKGGAESKLKKQGAYDWWTYLIEDDRSPDEALEELQRRLAKGEPRGRFFSPGGEPSSQLLKHRGVFGETILHACILCLGAKGEDKRKLNRVMTLTDYLINNFNPRTKRKLGRIDLVNAQYDACQDDDSTHFCEAPNCTKGKVGFYDGESPLHMAIVFNLTELVQALLDNEANMKLRAHGTFFAPGGPCYYGETPLNFSVSRGNIQIVKMLVEEVKHLVRDGKTCNFEEERQRVFDMISCCDSLGNNALHMAVVHRQMEIFDYLVNLYPGLNSISEEARKEIILSEANLWERFDDGSGQLTIEEFKECIRLLYTETALKGTGLYSRVWESFASDTPSNTIPDHHELLSLEVYAESAAREAVRRADPNGDGVVTRNEWKNWFMGGWWGRELLYLKNSTGDTALTLAAMQGEPYTFERVLSRLVQVKWIFGPVGCCTIPLEQIDTLDKDDLHDDGQIDDKERFSTAMTVILTAPSESLAVNQTFVQIQEVKWSSWCVYIYYASLFCYSMFLVAMYILGIEWVEELRRQEEDLHQDPSLPLHLQAFSHPKQANRLVAIERVVFGLVVLQLWVICVDVASAIAATKDYDFEVIEKARHNVQQKIRAEMRALGNNPDDFEHISAAFRAKEGMVVKRDGAKRRALVIQSYNYYQAIAIVMLLSHYIIWEVYGVMSSSAAFLLAIAAPFAHLSLFQYSVGLQSLGYLLIVMKRAVSSDVATFMQVLCVMVLGFALGLHVLRVDKTDDHPNGDVFAMWLDLYRTTLGEKPMWSKTNITEHPWVIYLFFIVFSLMCSVVLVRLLISMFNETYANAKKSAESVWRIERGQFILTMERRLIFLAKCTWCGPYLRRSIRKKLWIGDSWDDAEGVPGLHELTTVQTLEHDSLASSDDMASFGQAHLRHLKMSELWPRALAAGVTNDEVADALDTENPKDTVVRLMLRRAEFGSGKEDLSFNDTEDVKDVPYLLSQIRYESDAGSC
jgi:hypothetical protein